MKENIKKKEKDLLFEWGFMKFGEIYLHINGQEEWRYKLALIDLDSLKKIFIKKNFLYVIRKLHLSFPYEEESFNNLKEFLKDLLMENKEENNNNIK